MRQFIKKFNHYIQFVSGVTLTALMFMTVADIVIRKWLSFNFRGAYELTQIMLVIIVFFGVAYAHDNGDHVVIDFVYVLLPHKGKRVFSAICSILNMLLALAMCWMVFRYGMALIPRNAATSTLKIPWWPIVTVSTVGMIGYALSIVGDLIFVFMEGRALGDDAG